MDYNKLMEELDREVRGLPRKTSAVEGLSKGRNKGIKEAKEPIVEVDNEEDLIFEEEGNFNSDVEKSPEQVFTDSVNTYFNSLLDEGLEAEEAVEKVKSVVDSILPKDEKEGPVVEDTENAEISAEESTKEGCATESTTSTSFEEYQKAKEAKMLKRYKQLANSDLDKKKVAIEGIGEIEISIDDQALSRVSGEYGYSGKSLRKMVAEAIQRGDI